MNHERPSDDAEADIRGRRLLADTRRLEPQIDGRIGLTLPPFTEAHNGSARRSLA